MRYIKDNWPHVLFALASSACTAAFALGFAWALLGSRVANAERRLDDVDRAHIEQTHWQVQQNTADLSSAGSDTRRTRDALARIDVRLGIIESKLDALREAVKSRPPR